VLTEGTTPITIDIQNGEGRFATTSSRGGERGWINDETALNVDIKVKARVNLNAVYGGVLARLSDDDPDSYLAFTYNTSALPMQLMAVLDGTAIVIKEQAPPPLFHIYARALDHYLRFRVVTEADGSIALYGKIWIYGAPEPGAWTVQGVVPATGASAIRDRLGTRPGHFGLLGSQPITNRSTIYDDFQAMFYPGAYRGRFQDSASPTAPVSDGPAPMPLRRSLDGDACCTDDTECGTGTHCSAALNSFLGLGSNETACIPDHCTNKTLDADELHADCGGADCPPCACATNIAQGAAGYCSAACPCGVGDIECGTNAPCLPGLFCWLDNGWRYGKPVGTETCVPQHCLDRVQNADEQGIDWGGSCGGLACKPGRTNGDDDYCMVSCPCSLLQGDCDYDDECQAGLVCKIGTAFNIAYNICVPTHCRDNKKNFDEVKIDCGGADCGSNCP
jgi:hypothetical protein